MNPRQILDALPDEALIPVGFVRRLIAERVVEDSEPLADLSVDEVARALGRAASTIRAWAASGQLRAYKLNGREWRVTRTALREYQDRQRQASVKRPVFRRGTGSDLSSWRELRGLPKRTSV